jgi:uncharacterized protein (DUF1501 family)
LVVVFLNGGNDGNDVLVPTDAAYDDYAKARPSIAIKKDALKAFSSKQLGHSLALNPAMSALMPLYNSGKLAFLTNVGPLIEPTTVSDVLNNRAKIPPFLFSHPEQVSTVQGWMGDEDQSGWGGRALEVLGSGSPLKAPLVSVDNGGQTLVRGRRSRILSGDSWGQRNLGWANLTDKNNEWTQIVESISRLQSPNKLQAEHSKAFRGVFTDASELALGFEKTPVPKGNFANNSSIARQLKFTAQATHFYKMAGASRQIYAIQWGGFDTHVNQRSDDPNSTTISQDTQLSELSAALVAFQDSLEANGMSKEVTVLVTSEFGRTLDPAAGLGSDHAWGSHWWVIGGDVKGAQIYGNKFPSLVLGGVDDGDPGKRGYWVPQYSSDQVAGDLLQWLGLPSSRFVDVMPRLANFTKKTVGFMNG